jgi:membrane protein YdbS with pleckstrin-like domain
MDKNLDKKTSQGLKEFWRGARWILLAMLGIISSAGCANYAYESKEAFYWLPAVLNLTAYGIVVIRGLIRQMKSE